MSKAAQKLQNEEDQSEMIAMTSIHDPRRYMNRNLLQEIQRYHSKQERKEARNIQKSKKKIKIEDMPY